MLRDQIDGIDHKILPLVKWLCTDGASPMRSTSMYAGLDGNPAGISLHAHMKRDLNPFLPNLHGLGHQGAAWSWTSRRSRVKKSTENMWWLDYHVAESHQSNLQLVFKVAIPQDRAQVITQTDAVVAKKCCHLEDVLSQVLLTYQVDRSLQRSSVHQQRPGSFTSLCGQISH